MIRDAMLDSERYHAASVEGRLLFVELLLLADDYGLTPVGAVFLMRRTSAVKTPEAAAKLVKELASRDLLRVYDSGGQNYALIPRFGNAPRATKSKWPLPPKTAAFEVVHSMLSGGAAKRVWFYVYRIDHLATGCFYIGSRSSTKPPADDPYFGSGAASKWLAANRSGCTKTVVAEHQDIDSARAHETMLIASHASDMKCLNIAGTSGKYQPNQQLSGILHSGSARIPLDAPETETETETDKRKRDRSVSAAHPVAGAPPDTPAKKVGTRLPKEWQLPLAWGRWAQTAYPHWPVDTVREIAQRFRDHWTAKTGRDSTKLDWEATWRNWCKSDITQRQFPLVPAGSNGKSGETAFQRGKRERVSELTGGLAARAEPGGTADLPLVDVGGVFIESGG